jgi:hypothetical protein
MTNANKLNCNVWLGSRPFLGLLSLYCMASFLCWNFRHPERSCSVEGPFAGAVWDNRELKRSSMLTCAASADSSPPSYEWIN